MCQANFEPFYKLIGRNNDGDYGYGFRNVNVSVARAGKGSEQWSLYVVVTVYGAYSKIIPRQILIRFEGGYIFERAASNVVSDSGMEIYEFPLKTYEEKFFAYDIRTFTISDIRTGESIFGAPLYGGIIAEQVKCIKSQ